jgi:hypothetical protein
VARFRRGRTEGESRREREGEEDLFKRLLCASIDVAVVVSGGGGGFSSSSFSDGWGSCICMFAGMDVG